MVYPVIGTDARADVYLLITLSLRFYKGMLTIEFLTYTYLSLTYVNSR